MARVLRILSWLLVALATYGLLTLLFALILHILAKPVLIEAFGWDPTRVQLLAVAYLAVVLANVGYILVFIVAGVVDTAYDAFFGEIKDTHEKDREE